MRTSFALLTLITIGCASLGLAQGRPQPESQRKKPDSVQDRASYAIGFQLATSLKTKGILVDLDRVVQGLLDGLSGATPALSEEETKNTMAALQQQINEKNSSTSAKSDPKAVGDPLTCEIYRELTTHPDLKDFPVVVSKIENRYATLAGVAEVTWAQARAGGDLSNTFKMIETQRRKMKIAQSVASRVTGKDTAWREYTDASEVQVRQWADEGMKRACPGS
jgi:hypothetical protein